jgi:hypothetical protein
MLMPAGWFALWHTTMKDIGFFREIMGLNKCVAGMASTIAFQYVA